jgi:hypothetical protein
MGLPRNYRQVPNNTPVYVNRTLLRAFAADPTYVKWQAVKNGTQHGVRVINVDPAYNKNGRIKKLFAFYIALNNSTSRGERGRSRGPGVRNNARKPTPNNLNKLYLAAFGDRRRSLNGTIILKHRHQHMFFPGNFRLQPLNLRRPRRLNTSFRELRSPSPRRPTPLLKILNKK